jgi:hypothetical protein
MNSDKDIPRRLPSRVVGIDKLLYAVDTKKVATPIVINSMDPTTKTITAFNFTTRTVQTINTKDYRFFENSERAVRIVTL